MAVSKAKDLAKGPQLPGFMNPTAMNPVKFQQIKEKRKLLWSGKKAQKVYNQSTSLLLYHRKSFCYCSTVCGMSHDTILFLLPAIP